MAILSIYQVNDFNMNNLKKTSVNTGIISPPVKNRYHKIPVSEQFQIHRERPFLKHERATTTMLVGGLSPTHDFLFEASMHALGIKTKMLPPTNLDAFHFGREYGNNGYCNPGYFTVGNLIRFLKDLHRSGVSKEEIIEHYVFFTIGCNAPCRFGMLETEYRMALKDSGFEGFRIIVFENEGGLNQEVKGDGINVDPEFFLATINALNLADVLNDWMYMTRPYEIVNGATEAVLEEAKKLLYEKLKNKKRIELSKGADRVLGRLGLSDTVLFLRRFIEQITSNYYTDALKEVYKLFETVKVDRFRSKTTVKITGEFWAITTVGAGNFHMFEFLEKEGADLLMEPVASLVQFLFSKGKLRHNNRRKFLISKDIKHWWNFGQWTKNIFSFYKKSLTLWLGNLLFRREYRRLLTALGGVGHMLLDQTELQRIAQPFYNINIEGGEGYMEIAKNIYYHDNDLAHMVLSLKPFGCMPSTQSDAVQASVMERNKDMIFLPLETAGEGETNAQSRVLMSLGDARVKAKTELQEARAAVSFNMDDMRQYVEEHPALKDPFYKVPHRKGVVSKAANFVYHVNELMES
jgi:predicted nucleotide-binding protein (sugar kinase/HSP70/actin superfamily)